MYAIIKNNTVEKFPVYDLNKEFPNISFPAKIKYEDLPPNVSIVEVSPAPIYYPLTQKVIFPDAPIKLDGTWKLIPVVEALTVEEQLQAKEVVKQTISAQAQDRLDDFARTRNYDGILSACTYATSAVPWFQVEGQYAVQARDATWKKLLEILAEVEAGSRPMPAGYADIETELPSLIWPTVVSFGNSLPVEVPDAQAA